MLLFLFLLLPVSLCFFLVNSKERKFQPFLFMGVLTAILLCLIKALFVFSHRVVPNSLVENYFYFLMNQSVFPQVVLYGIFFAISKDELSLKFKSYFPIVCAFYALYLPYCVISSNESEVYSGFSIFVKPMIYLAMLCQCQLFLSVFPAKTSKKILKVIIAVFVILVYLFVPALLESLYVMNLVPVVFVSCTSLYIVLPFVFIFIKFLPRFFIKSKDSENTAEK